MSISDYNDIPDYSNYDIPSLKLLLKDIDKWDFPEVYEDIKTLIACKEFGVEATRTGNPNHVKENSGKKLPGQGNRGYRSGAGFYTK